MDFTVLELLGHHEKKRKKKKHLNLRSDVLLMFII